MTKTLSDQDDYLHLDFPTDGKDSWKENYYFSYVDKSADAMGMLHFSVQRHKGLGVIQSNHHIGEDILTYRNNFSFPAETNANEPLIVDDGSFSIEILEPQVRHRVSLTHEGTQIVLVFEARMPPYLFEHEEEEDISHMDVLHYEQSMRVSGEIHRYGNKFTVNCMGRRDHTWGYRNEGGFVGWEWAAFECENSSWCISIVLLADGSTKSNGFMMKSGENGVAIQDAEVEFVERDSSGAPLKTCYKVVMASGDTYTVNADCFTQMPIYNPVTKVGADENFATFVVEETGERGIGIDEHVRVVKSS